MRSAIALAFVLLAGLHGVATGEEGAALRKRAGALLEQGSRADRRELLATARLVLERLPRLEGSRLVRPLLEAALAADPTDKEGGFTLAMRLRGRVIEDGDAGTGVPFLHWLAEAYPHDEDLHRHEAARLLLRVGRVEEAGAELTRALEVAPDEERVSEVLMAIAALRAMREDVRGAIEAYEEAARRGDRADAHLLRARLLWRDLGDHEGARGALADARATVADAEPVVRERLERIVAVEVDAMRSSEAERAEIRRHLRRVDRLLLLIGVGWLVVLALGFGVSGRSGRA